jgi:hypothetical protein
MIDSSGLKLVFDKTPSGNPMIVVKDVPREAYESIKGIVGRVQDSIGVVIMFPADGPKGDLDIIQTPSYTPGADTPGVVNYFLKALAEEIKKVTETTIDEPTVEGAEPPDFPIEEVHEVSTGKNKDVVVSLIYDSHKDDAPLSRRIREDINKLQKAICEVLFMVEKIVARPYVAPKRSDRLKQMDIKVPPRRFMEAVDIIRGLHKKIEDALPGYVFEMTESEDNDGFDLFVNKKK